MSEHFLVAEGHCLAVFNSTHRVLQAEAFLKQLNLPFLLIPAPRALQTDCGLALRFDRQEAGRILAQLDEHDLQPAFVSCLTNGTYQPYEDSLPCRP